MNHFPLILDDVNVKIYYNVVSSQTLTHIDTSIISSDSYNYNQQVIGLTCDVKGGSGLFTYNWQFPFNGSFIPPFSGSNINTYVTTTSNENNATITCNFPVNSATSLNYKSIVFCIITDTMTGIVYSIGSKLTWTPVLDQTNYIIDWVIVGVFLAILTLGVGLAAVGTINIILPTIPGWLVPSFVDTDAVLNISTGLESAITSLTSGVVPETFMGSSFVGTLLPTSLTTYETITVDMTVTEMLEACNTSLSYILSFV